MGSGPGHIELERAVDSIRVGRRHRADLGDIDALASSIEREGLLQPITVTPDGVLVCGARRLAAIRTLGWKTVNVWVRSGITDRLGQLLAEQDENALHKPLTQLEAAALYRELKALLAEDATRRQEATRFRPASDDGEVGGGNLTPPQFEAGKARVQAAQMVTGRDSHTTLERIGRLEALAADESQPEAVRARAAEEVERIRAGASVYPSHLRVNAELSLAELDQLAADPAQSPEVRDHARAEAAAVREDERAAKAAELELLAAEALARVRAAGKKPKGKAKPVPVPLPGLWDRRSVRAFVLTWDDLASWWEHYDPAEVGPALTDEQWESFEATVAGTVEFAAATRTARAEGERRTA